MNSLPSFNLERKHERTLSPHTGQQALGSLLIFSILESLFARDAFADNVKPLVNKWVADMDALGHDVKDQKISQIIWQQKMEELYSQVNLTELLKLISIQRY